MVRQLVVSFDDVPPLPACDDGFIALGTTIKVVGSEAAFRRVDHDYVVAVARAGRQAGATRLGGVSALGADAKSSVFCNRVEGEMPEAVSALGYESVVLAQPSLLMGDREALGQPSRAAEVWAQRLLGPIAGLIPAGIRPVRARAVAAAWLAATQRSTPRRQRRFITPDARRRRRVAALPSRADTVAQCARQRARHDLRMNANSIARLPLHAVTMMLGLAVHSER